MHSYSICQLTMMKDNKTNATRQVHFANGFPPKGLVQAAVPYGRSSYTSPAGHYISLVCAGVRHTAFNQ